MCVCAHISVQLPFLKVSHQSPRQALPTPGTEIPSVAQAQIQTSVELILVLG